MHVGSGRIHLERVASIHVVEVASCIQKLSVQRRCASQIEVNGSAEHLRVKQG